MLIYSLNPEYTEAAKAAKLEGIVLLNLVVDAEGKPADVKVVRGVGDGPGGVKIAGVAQDVAEGLNEKAVEAVRQYRFKPALEGGKTCRWS